MVSVFGIHNVVARLSYPAPRMSHGMTRRLATQTSLTFLFVSSRLIARVAFVDPVHGDSARATHHTPWTAQLGTLDLVVVLQGISMTSETPISLAAV